LKVVVLALVALVAKVGCFKEDEIGEEFRERLMGSYNFQ
jgi:hypothetical protein